MPNYLSISRRSSLPRLPLEGSIDLTYRCNQSCRHCWTRLPEAALEEADELSLEEIGRIAGEARSMGCRRWNISGGEPMLRPDFEEIFDSLTERSADYSLNTNGTLITPAIARRMKRPGNKMIALYGATAEVYELVTRQPGGFEQALQGIAYLKEAGAGFIIQLVPLQANIHQWPAMVELAQSLSRHYRLGATWLYLSACGSAPQNAEILAQRISPREITLLEPPLPSSSEVMENNTCESMQAGGSEQADAGRLFADCIARRRAFHIDPYGRMTFCCFIKDPSLRCDLRKGSFSAAWEKFIPGVADAVRGEEEYFKNCAVCPSRKDCGWCPVFGYLECRRFSAPVRHLCQIAQERRSYRADWARRHRRYFESGGITIQVESDLPILPHTFHAKFTAFERPGPGPDTVIIRHHYEIPDRHRQPRGQLIYRKPPWIIRREGDSWIYAGMDPGAEDPQQIAIVNRDHTHAEIFHRTAELYDHGNLHSLTMFPTDQILLARLLADRQGCILHASGVKWNGWGLLFIGHSSAGKSTTVKWLRDHAEILCDDRIIVRRWPEGYKIHGTWSHGEVPSVSSSDAPLRAMLFLCQSPTNRLTRITDMRLIVHRLLACLIKPLETADWWHKSMDLIEALVPAVPCYEMEFDKSGNIVALIEGLTAAGAVQ